MSRFYNDKITNLFLNPTHSGVIENASVQVQIGQPGQSDVVQLSLLVKSDIVQQARFKAHGKMTTIAAAEYVCAAIENMPITKLSDLKFETIIAALQIPSIRYSSAILLVEALEQAQQQLR